MIAMHDVPRKTMVGLRLKDASKFLGRHFACGASVSETAAGTQEIVIQGDVMLDLPEVLAEHLSVRTADLTLWKSFR